MAERFLTYLTGFQRGVMGTEGVSEGEGGGRM